MMTVRFPNGFSVQYDTASYVIRRDGYTDLYTKKDGNWLAQVPNTALIESMFPCRTYNPLTDQHDRRLEDVARELRSVKRKLAKMQKEAA